MYTDTTPLDPILLNDEQMRQFLVDGYLVFQPTVPDGAHEAIDEKFSWLVENEPNPGNNILPRLPELNLVLESPEIRGAMISLLGENYLVHPHRYWHYLKPNDDQDPEDREGIWAQVKSQSHQDSYTPSGQPKFHYLRYARFMYYSHEVEEAHGPTHVIPGSQYHAGLSDEDREREMPVTGRAGTVFLSHFDLGHAAGVNVSGRVRHMIKFIFMRTEEPRQPTWNGGSTEWKKPAHSVAPYDLEPAWRHHWDWICGRKGKTGPGISRAVDDALAILKASEDIHKRLEALNTLADAGPNAASAIDALTGRLNTGPQAERTCAVYALSAIGDAAVAPLIDSLSAAGERESAHEIPAYFNSGTITMDDAAYALSAIGAAAVDPLLSLLDSPYEQTKLNAVFALGEIGPAAGQAVSRLSALLEDPSYRVIRFAANALGTIGDPQAQTVLCKLLESDREEWAEAGGFGWLVRYTVHANAAMALARLGAGAAASEAVIIRHLNHPFGQVGVFLTEALRRIGTPGAVEALVRDLNFRRWDASLHAKRAF